MDIVAFDLETHLIEPGNLAPKPVCMACAFNWAEPQLFKGLKDIEAFLKDLLEAVLIKDILIVNQNIAFDFACILEHLPALEDLVWEAYAQKKITCIMEREKLLDISIGEFKNRQKGAYSLKSIAKRYLYIDLEKEDTWRLRYEELEDVPLEFWPQDAIDYPIKDAETALQIYFDQEERSRYYNYTIPTQYLDSQAGLGLYLMSAWGIESDYSKVEKLWNHVVEKMWELVPHLKDITKPVENSKKIIIGRSVPPIITVKKEPVRKLVSETYRGEGEIPLTDGGKSGNKQISTAAKTIKKCDSKVLKKLVEFEKYRKTANTFISKLFYPVIHPRFNAVGCTTDRTSSFGPNVQNQLKLLGLRECFRARVGCVLISCDFDAQEVRTFAQTCYDLFGFSKLHSQFNEDPNYDPHLDFASTMLNIPFDEIKIRYANGELLIEDTRTHAKVGIFGFLGGMGTRTFVVYAEGWGITITLDRSEEIKSALWTHLPEIIPYFENVNNLVNGSVLEIGRSGFRRADVGYCDIANGQFQSLAAHITKESVFETSRSCYNRKKSPLYGSRLVAAIHDEIIIESPLDKASNAAKCLEDTMITTMQKWTPDIPAAASAAMMYNWSKKAKPVYKDGILIPWEER